MSAARRLARALEVSARAAGCPARIVAVGERPWASATFVGARHALSVEAAPSMALSAWLADLPRALPVVPGHVVAEMAVDRSGARLTALTLEA